MIPYLLIEFLKLIVIAPSIATIVFVIYVLMHLA